MKLVDCGGVSNGVTHTNPDAKDEIKVVWRPPPDFEGKVYAMVGFV